MNACDNDGKLWSNLNEKNLRFWLQSATVLVPEEGSKTFLL